MKLKIGDTVLVTAGKDKGKTGKIELLFLAKSGKGGKVRVKEDRVTVSGANIYKKAKKATQGQSGGIIEFSRPLPLANVALICPHCKKPTRIGMMLTKTDKARICKKCKRQIDTKGAK